MCKIYKLHKNKHIYRHMQEGGRGRMGALLPVYAVEGFFVLSTGKSLCLDQVIL